MCFSVLNNFRFCDTLTMWLMFAIAKETHTLRTHSRRIQSRPRNARKIRIFGTTSHDRRPDFIAAIESISGSQYLRSRVLQMNISETERLAVKQNWKSKRYKKPTRRLRCRTWMTQGSYSAVLERFFKTLDSPICELRVQKTDSGG